MPPGKTEFVTAGRFQVSQTRAKEEAQLIIDNIVRTVKNEWDNSLRRAGVSAKDCAAISNAFIYEGFFATAK